MPDFEMKSPGGLYPKRAVVVCYEFSGSTVLILNAHRGAGYRLSAGIGDAAGDDRRGGQREGWG